MFSKAMPCSVKGFRGPGYHSGYLVTRVSQRRPSGGIAGYFWSFGLRLRVFWPPPILKYERPSSRHFRELLTSIFFIRRSSPYYLPVIFDFSVLPLVLVSSFDGSSDAGLLEWASVLDR